MESLQEKLKQGDKALGGNKGYRKYLKREGEQAAFRIDEDKLQEEVLYDGLWVLRTNTSLSIDQVAFQYKQVWMVEQAFRAVKRVLETRPIYHYHKCDDTIRGHVFCSFLAFILMKELMSRVEARGKVFEWEDIKRDLVALRGGGPPDQRRRDALLPQDGAPGLLPRGTPSGRGGDSADPASMSAPGAPNGKPVCGDPKKHSCARSFLN